MAVKVGLLGRLALQQGLISNEQLRLAIREQGRHPEKRLGEVLVSRGFIDSGQLEKLLTAQSRIEQKKGQRVRRETPVPTKKPVPDGVALAAIELKQVTATEGVRSPALHEDEPTPDVVKAAVPRPAPKAKRAADGPKAVPMALPRTELTEDDDDDDHALPEIEALHDRSLRTGAHKAVQRRSARAGDTDTARWLHELLMDAVGGGASDILLQPDRVARFRRFGRMHELTTGPLAAATSEQLLADCLDERARAELARHGQATFVYDAGGVGRFRVSVFHAMRGVSGVFHRVPTTAPTFDELGLPSSIAKLTTFPDGLLLVAGPLASGKSFTLAALVNLINEERPEHIITIENNIECLHPSRVSLVSQIEVGTHALSAAGALRNAVREDSDIIAVDELSGGETVQAAVSAADSGHLVIGVVPMLTAVRTIDWLLDAFPVNQQAQACGWLASSLRAILVQRLLPTADERSSVLALEVLFVDDTIRKHIRSRNTAQIQKVLLSGRSRGSRALDESLTRLLRSGHISFDVARANAINPNMFRS